MVRWLLVDWSNGIISAASGVAAVGVHIVCHGSLRLGLQ